MDETRECRLAVILARGLRRVRQRNERTGTRDCRDEDAPQPPAAGQAAGEHPPADDAAPGNKQGERR